MILPPTFWHWIAYDMLVCRYEITHSLTPWEPRVWCVCVCVCVCVREQTCCNLRDREYTQVLQRQNGDTAILHDRLTGVDEVYARSFGNGLTLILHRLM